MNGRVNSIIDCKLDKNAVLPQRAHSTDAGADLFAIEDTILNPGEWALVDTGIATKIPIGFMGMVVNRSSQRVNRITSLGTGIIDSDYRGNIKVFLINTGNEQYKIEAGKTKIAQLIIVPVILAQYVDCWNDTARGVGGFGSTN